MEQKQTNQTAKEIGNFKSSYFLRLINGTKIIHSQDGKEKLKVDYNPFRPIYMKLTDSFIEYKRRNWYLFGVNKIQFHWQNVIGISIDKHFIGCHIKIMTSGSDDIYVHGFSKAKANHIYTLASQYISSHTQKSRTDTLAEAISNAIDNTKGKISVADELKKMKELLDNGVITQEEFDTQKQKLIAMN